MSEVAIVEVSFIESCVEIDIISVAAERDSFYDEELALGFSARWRSGRRGRAAGMGKESSL